ncbi:MAG: hypothetical protein ACJAY2_002436 [Pseudomonadales bacterium]|jgi:hypothetical protein
MVPTYQPVQMASGEINPKEIDYGTETIEKA